MSSVGTKNPVKDPLLSHQGSLGPEKHRVETDCLPAAAQPPPLRRYWIRPLVAIFVPIILTAYYGVIWLYLVQGIPGDDAVKYRHHGGSLIFYSWFLIGVFALSWSKYGLTGVEAAMLYHSRFWAAPNMAAFLMHSDNTWSSPSGWWKAIQRRQFTHLWTLLALTSLLPFIAIPLSGLVFEIGDGYVRTSAAPSLLGRNRTTFNERYDLGNIDNAPAQTAWRIGSEPVIPGYGVIYTNISTDRSAHSEFEKMPNRLPTSASIPDLFLPAQADKPVSGKAWGLRMRYECSAVRSASQFTVLSEKSESSILSTCGMDDDQCLALKTPSGNSITLRNTTRASSVYNVESYFEVGTTAPLSGRYMGNWPEYTADDTNTTMAMVLEYAAWQYRTNRRSEEYDDLKFSFNATVEPTVDGLGSPFTKLSNGSYEVNEDFFKMKGDWTNDGPVKEPSTNASQLVGNFKSYNKNYEIIDVAPPIGVRCVASSDLGYAELDGITASFSNFERAEPDVDPVYMFGPERFGFTARATVGSSSFYQHYISGGLPGLQPNSNSNRYRLFVDGLSLLRSINLAFALDASDLMYGVTSSFKQGWLEPELTSSRETKILTGASLIPNDALGHIVLVLLCLWAVLSAGLGVWYGFRTKPSDKIDGYVMLRKGADLADELRGNQDFMEGKPFHHNEGLRRVHAS